MGGWGLAVPAPADQMPLQKVRSREGSPLSAHEFQQLFSEVDRGVVQEVTGLGLCRRPARATRVRGGFFQCWVLPLVGSGWRSLGFCKLGRLFDLEIAQHWELAWARLARGAASWAAVRPWR